MMKYYRTYMTPILLLFLAWVSAPVSSQDQSGGVVMQLEVTVIPGKMDEALDFAEKAADHLAKNHGVKIEVFLTTDKSGVEKLCIQFHVADMEQLDELLEGAGKDDTYKAMVAKASASSIQDPVDSILTRVHVSHGSK
jgi:ABC-type phosphate/phosphonate transport system substrate-binding protein